MSNSKFEDMINKVKKEKTLVLKDTEETSCGNEIKKIDDIKGSIMIREEDKKDLGFLDRMQVNRLQSKKKLELQEIIFDTQIEKLKHESEAITRQSEAYWNSKSVAFAEGLKTYAQQNMQLLEASRQENKNDAITKAYEQAHKKMVEIFNKNLPDSMKEELIKKIFDVRDSTVKRIEEDTLANKYNLGT